jgi:hypothetical protein
MATKVAGCSSTGREISPADFGFLADLWLFLFTLCVLQAFSRDVARAVLQSSNIRTGGREGDLELFLVNLSGDGDRKSRALSIGASRLIAAECEIDSEGVG